jgi:hypothetical protein
MPELQLLPAQSGVFFRDEDHKYFYRTPQEQIEVPSSSHIIELAGGKDFPKEHWKQSLMRKGLTDMGAEYFMDRVRDIRADIGTETHALIGSSLGLDKNDEEIASQYCREMEAIVIHGFWNELVRPRIGKVYVIEEPMIHPGGCYGFTPDLIAEVDGILSVCDWKTNQPEHFAERYKRLCDYAQDDEILASICELLTKVDAEAGKVKESTFKVRGGWQMQQGSYAFGVEAVGGLRVERGINFGLSVDGVSEKTWNRPDLDQGWLQFAGGLALHHQRKAASGGHPVFGAALNALGPLMHAR